MNVGERIKQRRKELNISADDIAKKLGISRSTVFRYEKGDIEKVPLDIIEKISIPLRTTPSYLMGWSDAPDSNTGSLAKDMSTIFGMLNHQNQQNVYEYAVEKLNVQTEKRKTKVTSFNKNIKNPIITFAAHSENSDKVYTDEEKNKLFNDLEEVARKHDIELFDD
ncbi:helix-turn-helix domain-containing protein [Candidatus Enterococcus ferrettii]|uniref:HTH cro/C1-type domain-containing protein n=1 Tax=Candidatus Enterococcus ferrettii TaxID=2815324 RepID=A0ABV0EZ75_9ENTE|nr:helix-turn-helix transcriptional regulator [Enterococcus sp. 665A]MBO1342120.1 helix-turn-helix transcriptional regulator [Enterococcus sp. 665A]